jgi:D-amino-acid dehydrogenase
VSTVAGGRAVVVGGGVVGVCAAYYLARDGVPVTLLEKGSDVAAGSSYGNSGLVVPSHSIPLAAPGVLAKGLRWLRDPESPFYIKPRLDRELAAWLWRFRGACTARHVQRSMPVLRDLSRQSLALYRELAKLDGLDFGFAERGVLLVFRTAAGFAEGMHEVTLLASAGIPARSLDGQAARTLEPALSDAVVGAVLFPDDAQLIPDRFVRNLARVVEGMGVDLRREVEVLGFRSAGRRIVAVETTRGDVPAGTVVLAAGAWSPELTRALGLALPVQAAKGYSVTCRRPPGGPGLPLLLGEARMAVTPMADTLRFGGTLELAGLDLSVNHRRVAALMRRAAGYLRGGTDRLERLLVWRGLRPCTPDGLPIVGRPAAIDNLVLATGHAMIGMSLGPVTGQLVAQLVTGAPLAADIAALHPQRFA